MNVTKVKRLAHQLKELASELEDAIKEDVAAYSPPARNDQKPWFPPNQAERLGYRYSDDDDGYTD